MQTEQQVIRNPHALYAELPCTYTGLDTMLERYRTMELEPDILADAAYGSVIGHRIMDLYAADPAVRESYVLTEEDCAFLRDLIVNAGRCVENDEDLMRIIVEEASACFAEPPRTDRFSSPSTRSPSPAAVTAAIAPAVPSPATITS